MSQSMTMPTRALQGSVVLSTVWRARWIILGAAVVAGAGGYVVSSSQEPLYTAESRLVLSAVADFDPLGSQSFADSSRYVAKQIPILSSAPIVTAALAELPEGTEYEELTDALAVSASADSDVVVVETTAPTAEGAAARANAVVAGYREYVRARVAELAANSAATTTDPAVADRILTQAAAYGDGLAVVDPAVPPTEPSAPVPLRDALVLAVVAALVAAGLALLRRGPASTPRLEFTDAHVLGNVPARRVEPRRNLTPEPEEFAHPLVSLGYTTSATAGPVFVTGLSHASGAAAVVHGLAIAAAAQGRRVLMVDADPQRRELLDRVEEPRPGRRMDELAHGAREADVLVRHTGDDGRLVHVAVLGAAEGKPVADEDAHAAFGKVQADHDLVLVAIAPITESPVALGLLRQAGAVVVASELREEPGTMTELRQQLALAGVPLAGVMLTRTVRGPRIGRQRRPGPVGAQGSHTVEAQSSPGQ